MGGPMKTVTLVLVGLAISLTIALAHVSDTGQDYSKYFQHNGGFCCNQSDCQPVSYEFTSHAEAVRVESGDRPVVQLLLRLLPT